MERTRSQSSSRMLSNRNQFRHLYEFCTVADLATLAGISRDCRASVNLTFRDRLLEEGATVEPDVVDFMRLYKELHLKSVILLPISSLNVKDRLDVFSGAKISKKRRQQLSRNNARKPQGNRCALYKQ